MGEFQRSPSKVWWGNASPTHNQPQWRPTEQTYPEDPLEEHEAITNFNEIPPSRIHTPELSRNSSGSPNSHKSQDSGFSDSEAHLSQPEPVNEEPYLKHSPIEPIKNLNTSYPEKYTPKKFISTLIKETSETTTPHVKFELLSPLRARSENSKVRNPKFIETPKIDRESITKYESPLRVRSENSKVRNRFVKRVFPRVNRNLFSCAPNSNEDVTELDSKWAPQKVLDSTECSTSIEFNTVIHVPGSPKLSQTQPLVQNNWDRGRLNVSAPVGELEYDPNQISFEETTLPCCTTPDPIHPIEDFQSPNYHSTPKQLNTPHNPIKRQLYNNILESKRFETFETVPSSTPPPPPPVAKWLEELSKLYEAECMITLQSKSLAADLSRQVAESATQATVTLKSLFGHCKLIYSDFHTILKQLSDDKVEHLGPLIQSLNGNITEFILSYIINSQASVLTKTEECGEQVQEILQYCDFLRTALETDCSINEVVGKVEGLKRLFRAVEHNILAIQIQVSGLSYLYI